MKFLLRLLIFAGTEVIALIVCPLLLLLFNHCPSFADHFLISVTFIYFIILLLSYTIKFLIYIDRELKWFWVSFTKFCVLLLVFFLYVFLYVNVWTKFTQIFIYLIFLPNKRFMSCVQCVSVGWRPPKCFFLFFWFLFHIFFLGLLALLDLSLFNKFSFFFLQFNSDLYSDAI